MSDYLRSSKWRNQVARVGAQENVVVLYIDPNTETEAANTHTYWTPDEARKIAGQLIAAAEEVEGPIIGLQRICADLSS